MEYIYRYKLLVWGGLYYNIVENKSWSYLSYAGAVRAGPLSQRMEQGVVVLQVEQQHTVWFVEGGTQPIPLSCCCYYYYYKWLEAKEKVSE